MSKVSHFTDLLVWQKSHSLFLDATEDVERFPRTQAAKVVADQMLRSSGRTGATIAEGSNARSTKEYVHYLDISRRSAAETENWYYCVRDKAWLPDDIVADRLSRCVEIQRMLQGLMR